MILVDTNIWGRIANKRDPLHSVAARALQQVIRQNLQPAIAAQNLYEFWVVATRPVANNGLGWSAARVSAWVDACRRVCTFLPEESKTFDMWLTLVRSHGTQGKSAHDARLVAVMKLCGIASILTFNSSDFARYGITVVDPRNL
jgi:predicted nucleic acid-binding protein